ncbi:hypothetical protein HAP47_0005260 [Bradyrhizobium sp. 41S5]|uniref:hypothetical protein n=1 Tax=Bradyrhizobium sp. 41S5 TaxID=1404443 RepID=UPI001E5A8888|nr:hypothetical protein [Bradyrhizobium sp. 41S5]UFX46120.1 hypothetical protein HAP47_0005260 [Bradyrhizobium sp. 41S5]
MMKVIFAAVAAIALSGVVRAADDVTEEQTRGVVRAVCFAGRVGMKITEVMEDMHLTKANFPQRFRDIWEGCRQESVKDLSCYPFTINGNDRTIFLPGDQPADARIEPLTADCKGRIGRWPIWKPAREDKAETMRMGIFYAKNPPGELPEGASR